ncbi:class I SAM-dependent methyltransferase [Ruania halotolerans]|uniref:class I SAM-dependent methyltransferase n=1 Tax=Ruania halotolerans TaxID=2897773 RepID=UPI001E60514A|nr:methyltransferase domain-containing protein [Ruania halotolerans]UFU06313.1 methyltransferase domain-containing protein [Ruania halotolerans]
MSLPEVEVVDDGFGRGGTHPYDTALLRRTPLTLLDLGDASAPRQMDVPQFLRAADAVEAELVRSLTGPLLDVGCGPGRMVAAASRAGLRALGVDISPTAIAIARQRGLPVLLRSVDDPLPGEGRWGSILLLDGNIGIGGDPAALLRRCAALAAREGVVVVEAHPDDDHDTTFDAVLADPDGGRSHRFRWAESGRDALARHARAAGLRTRRQWRRGERSFVVLGR